MIDEDLVGSSGGHEQPVVIRRKDGAVDLGFQNQLLNGGSTVDGIEFPECGLALGVVVACQKLTIIIRHQIARSQLDFCAMDKFQGTAFFDLQCRNCLLYTSPSPRDLYRSRMPSSA